jgi:hypothetical protein
MQLRYKDGSALNPPSASIFRESRVSTASVLTQPTANKQDEQFVQSIKEFSPPPASDFQPGNLLDLYCIVDL